MTGVALVPVATRWVLADDNYGTRLMAYRAVDHYVLDRVQHFLGRRHKVPARGTKRFSADVVFGKLGVFPLRRFHLGSPAHARV